MITAKLTGAEELSAEAKGLAKIGLDGKDGVSATHSWNGTILTITSASGTSSANLKGDKGDQGEKGADGAKGDKGDTGPAYTLTDADKAQIVNDVLAALPTWNGGSY